MATREHPDVDRLTALLSELTTYRRRLEAALRDLRHPSEPPHNDSALLAQLRVAGAELLERETTSQEDHHESRR